MTNACMDERLDGVRVYRDRLTRMYVSSLPLLDSGNKNAIPVSLQAGWSIPCPPTRRPHFLLLPPTKEEVHVFAHVRLSVGLLARLLKNACIDLHEMLRVDRCRDMDN